MFDLTVLIPTYNRADRLVKSLNSYLSEDLKNVEFLVIDNDSSDNTFLSIKNYIENGKIRYEKNYKNIGANRSLYFGFLKAKSKWICILPDDDYLEKGFLSELIIATKKNSNKGLIIPAQKHMNGEYTKCFDKSTSLSKGIEAMMVSYMYSGSITGLCFNKQVLDYQNWKLDDSIYPQIRNAINLSKSFDIYYLVPDNYPIIGIGDPISIRINDSANRPLDYGVFERLDILYDKSLALDKDIINKLSITIFMWTISIFEELYAYNKSYAFKYLNCLITKSEIKNSFLFWLILYYNIFIKYNFNLKTKLTVVIKTIPKVIASILLNRNNEIWFIIKNRNSLLNKAKYV